jgi:predicted MFS family arabinose efflux permease
MSATTSIKVLVPAEHSGQLFKWVSILTGSKNTLKGLGFFLGGFLLTTLGFRPSLYFMALVLAVVTLISIAMLQPSLGKASSKPKFTELLSKSRSLNLFSAARLCLFASRDVWFVVALPVYLASQMQWQHSEVGAFLALWIIFYGFVQALSPRLLAMKAGYQPSAQSMSLLGWYLAITTAALIGLLLLFDHQPMVMVAGLMVFALVFAVNSALHSYGILALAHRDGASLDVGFYYMSNALGRLLGTLLSGLVFEFYGLLACLAVSVVMAILAALLVRQVQLQ